VKPTLQVQLTKEEFEHLIDALNKGASRHEAFTRFSPMSRSVAKHERAAIAMRRLYRRFVELSV
jgi:hypothetical protein